MVGRARSLRAPLMTEHLLTTWLLTYAVHGALFAALAAVAERTCWGAVASRRDAFWKLALVGGIVTSTVFVAAGSAPAGAAVHLRRGSRQTRLRSPSRHPPRRR
jgi:hypothetical protein